MKPPTERTRFLGLSLASGAFEIGVVVGAAASGWPVELVLAVGLAYQLAAVFVDGAVHLGLIANRIALVLAALAALAVVVVHTEKVVFVVATFVVALVLHSMRGDGPKGTSTMAKRSFRVVGFVIGAVAGLLVVPITALILLGIDVASRAQVGYREPGPLHLTSAHSVMVIHQSHYFVYAYALVILLVTGLGVPPALAGIAFSVGWVSYTLTERVLAGVSATTTVVFGHFLAALCLLVIGMAHDSFVIVLIAWFFSGFGGGSVFRLARWVATSSSPAETHLWENVGHVVGVLVAMVIVFLTAQLVDTFFVGAALATATAVSYLALSARTPRDQPSSDGTFAM